MLGRWNVVSSATQTLPIDVFPVLLWAFNLVPCLCSSKLCRTTHVNKQVREHMKTFAVFQMSFFHKWSGFLAKTSLNMIISPAVISEGHKVARMNGTLSSTESLYVNLVLYTATIASDSFFSGGVRVFTVWNCREMRIRKPLLVLDDEVFVEKVRLKSRWCSAALGNVKSSCF